MAFVLKDRVKESTTTTGTGTLTLGGAVTGFEAFSAIGDSNTTYYAIVHRDGGTPEWEVGIGTYTSSGTTFSRDTVIASSNSDSAVNLSSGTKDVFVTQPAERAVYTSASPAFTGLTLTGAVSGTSGVFTGTVSAATFDGALIGNVTGDIDGANGSFSTEVSATAYKGGSLTLTGIVSGTSGVFTGTVSAATFDGAVIGDVTGDIDGANGSFSTAVSATAITGAGLTLTGPVSGTSGVFSGTVSAATFDGALIGDVTGDLTGDVTGNLTGNASGSAATVTGAAQTAITSLGTLTGLTLSGPVSGTSAVFTGIVSATTFDGAVTGDITGNITGDVTGSIDGANGSFSTAVSATAITGAGLTLTGPVSGTSGVFTGTVSATTFDGAVIGDVTGNVTGDVTGNLTGNASGSAATVTGAAQTAITSLGTLTGLTLSGPVSGTSGVFTGTVSAATFDGALIGAVTGNVTGDVTGNVTGNASGTAATVTGAAQTAITSLGTLTGLSMSGDLDLQDNDKILLGTGDDLEIYHDASHSYIADTGTGSLVVKATDLYLQDASGNRFLYGAAGGTVELYHNANAKLTTTSGGVTITGTVTATTFVGALTGNVTGNTSGSSGSTTGNAATATALQTARAINGTNFDGTAAITVDPHVEDDESTNAARYLTFVDNSTAGTKRLNEDSSLNYNPSTNTLTAGTFSGALTGNVTGNCSGSAATVTTAAQGSITSVGTLTGLTMSGDLDLQDNDKILIGTGDDLKLYHDGTNSYIDNVTGGIYIRTNNTENSIVALANAQVELYYDASKKLETTSAGVSVTGTITASGNITAFSSEAAKDNIETIPNALDTVNKLRGVSFNWKENGEKSHGLIYEEVEKVVPELTRNYNDSPSVAYQNTVALLIEAIKELKTEVNELKKGG